MAHSLGAFIAYDGITSLWDGLSPRTSSPQDVHTPLAGLPELAKAADRVLTTPTAIGAFQKAQFDLWQGLRRQVRSSPRPVSRANGWRNEGREVLSSSAPFAVVRWTNLWFPGSGLAGDWSAAPPDPLRRRRSGH